MESLSRPFSKKLSNGNSFSAYDGVFSGGATKFGAPTKYSSGIEDYGEIFGGASSSRPSSIPILDLSSALDEAKVSADATRTSKLDYSKIFGGFRDEDIAASYDELFSKPKGAKKLSGEARTPAETASPSNGSDRLNRYKEEGFQCEAPNQSFEGLKQFNMSYHKTNQTSNDGTNGTTHIAQLRAVPGFTRFIGENPPLQKAEGDKSVPLPKVDANLTKKQNSDGIGRFKSQSHMDKFCPSDKSFCANENSPKTHPPKMSSPLSKPANVITNKREPKRSMDSNFKVPRSESSKADPADCSPSFSDEEIDVNSAAAASAAALRKALEKAQASIRIAKELMERKKDGPLRFSKSSSKDGLDVRKRREDKVTVEASRIREKNAKETCENADVVLQVFTKSEREKARRSGKVAPDFKEREKIFVIKEVSGEKTGINLESTEGCEAPRQFSELANTGECRAATLACKHKDGSNEVMLSVDTQCGKDMETSEKILEQLDGNDKKVDGEAQESEDLEGKLNVVKMAQDWAQNVHRLDTTQEVHDQEESEKVGVGQEDEETEMKQKAISGQEKCEKILEESLVLNKNEEFGSQESKANNNEEVVDVAQECMEGDKKQGEVFQKEQKNKSSIDVHKEESENRLKRFGEQAEIEHRLQAACEWVDYEETCEVEIYEKRENDAQEGEDNEKNLDKINELDIKNKRLTPDGEESERQENNNDWEGNEEILVEACEYEETESIQLQRETESNETAAVNREAVQKIKDLDATIYACEQDADERATTSHEVHRHEQNDNDLNFEDNERKSDVSQSSCEFKDSENGLEEFDATIDACEQDADERATTSHEVHRHEQNDNDLNFEDNERKSDVSQSSCEFKDSENGLEDFEVAHELGEKEMSRTGGLVVGISEHIEIENKMKDATEALHFNDNPVTIGLGETNSGPKQTGQNEKESESATNLGSVIKILECESGGEKIAEDEIAFDPEEVESDFIDTALDERRSAEMGKKMEASQSPSMIKGEEEKTIGIDEEFKTRQTKEKNEENPNQTFAVEEKETKDTVQKEVKVEKENLSKNDEANKREREREKDRIAVERAIREARERAFAEARERAERAAVERATTEARQRVMAEARVKYEKASAATKSSVEKASIEAKLRAERAAVERATVEARERALEKALSQKSISGAREQAERYVAEKFSGLSRDNDMRPSIPPSDTQKSDGPSGESAERQKARLERHQRTMERAAKALAEKNKRDFLAQKEQAEKNRLAETLDAEVKRWSSGKEGNLRALLSTLQYILGPDSSWQPISLTEIVTTSAVKKAYRKATLHVHPDKLQQRGASIQQKYICEKVFDLLKAAWNRFNYEER